MRLTALTLNRYGNFDTERITFDARPGVLNLLLAPNGGGKSVLRAAFCDLLFGIGGQTPMGFRYGYPGMRIGAEAIGPDHEPFAFGRRKGQGNTLVDEAGTPLDPATMARLLGRTDRARLERLFALDTERLRQGESDLLASDGELGPALVSGAGGAHDLRALRRSLEETRDALAPIRRSSQRPFYVALARFVEARKRGEASLLRPEQWQKQQQELDAAEQRRIDQNRLAEIESAEIAKLERVRRVIPWLAARDAAAAWLQTHPEAPVLDPSLAPRLNEARSAIVMAEQRALRERNTAAHVSGQLGRIVVDETVLEEAETIGRLVEATGAARKAMTDLPAVTAQVAALRAAVMARLRELGFALPVERAMEAIPPRAVVNRTRRLVQSFAACQQAAQATPGPVAEAERERDTVLAEREALPAPGDVSDLDSLVKEIRGDGDPARRAGDAAALRSDTAEALAAALARVPGWTLGDAALVALAPLLPDTYDRHAAEVDTKRTEMATRFEALRSARQARDEARGRLASIEKAAPALDAEALVRARERRDSGWRLIYRRAFTADAPTLRDEQGFAGPLPLPLAYERAVTAADAIADCHIRDAELIERGQSARAVLREAEARVHDADIAYAHAAQAQAATERAWQQICRVLPLGESPSIAEVRGFLAARERVIETRRAHLAACAMEAALRATQLDWAARLAALLPSSASPILPAMLAAADRRLAEAQQVERTRAALEARSGAAEKALAEAQAQQRQANRELADWRDNWTRAMKDLGRPAEEDPQVIDDVLQAYADLDQGQRELAGLEERLIGMRRDNARYAEEATSLASRLAPDLTETDPFALVTAVRQRLRHAGELERQRDLLRKQMLDASEAAALAERQLADRRAGLQAILTIIGASSIEAAEHRLALAAERARRAAALAEAEAKLGETGDLRPLAELREAVAVLRIEDVPEQIDRASERRKAAQAAAQEAAAAASALSERMQRLAAETGTSDAAADQQSAIATIGRVLEEAVVHHLAAEMLSSALTSIEQQGQPVLLRRIGALFSCLTGGFYTGVLTEMGDDGVARLILVQRDFPDERQSVRELSEGTRDQLYLALRLAAIEEHAAVAPPLPFIGDDILQTFDDDRALAAMRALQAVSERVQVILLTHHRHVLDLAAGLSPGSVHLCKIGSAALQHGLAP